MLRSGDVKAFESLYEDNYPLVRDYLLKWNIRYEEAEEIAQDVMLSVWERREKFSGFENRQLFCYIYTTARNMTLKLEREKRKQEELMKTLRLDPDISYESPEEELVFNEQIEQVNRIVSRMPKVRRRIFEMKYNDGLSNEEIARELNITQSTVRSHIRYISQEIMTYA
ncbi:RNA polymerase sigma-70 factor [Alistipes indistinctus]|uniref:RNA polymerase sigma factor n=1 Tax=Alistipes indistinctus TaxID=626932 RepID=UPI0036F3F745